MRGWHYRRVYIKGYYLAGGYKGPYGLYSTFGRRVAVGPYTGPYEGQQGDV